MLVRQSKNTFVRFYEERGYVTNQMTRHDRTYNETGADFLRAISRIPRDVNEIVAELSNLYGDSVEFEALRCDFISFINDLETHNFLVTGESPAECDSKDLDFSYSLGNMKTNVADFSQDTEQYVEENTYNYMLEADQRKAVLKSIQFELTSRCNERCIHCYLPNSRKDEGGDMSYEQVCDILDQFVLMGGLHVSLSGGEVFLHKDIIKIIQYCREKDLEICILSNLISLKDEQIPFIKEANVSYIQTSLYSMDPFIHDEITTVKGSHEKTKRALEKLIAADIPVQISCPLMKKNKDGYKAVLRYAQTHKIKAFSDYIMMGESNFCTDNLVNRLSVQETERVIRDIIEYDIDYPRWIRERRSHLETIDKERYAKQALCGAGLNSICVAENGDLFPCPGWQSMVVGNVNEQSLMFIWENSVELKKLRRITHGDFPQCVDCEAQKYCSMCLERNCNENKGDIFKVGKHFCDVAFLTKRLHEEYQQKGLI